MEGNGAEIEWSLIKWAIIIALIIGISFAIYNYGIYTILTVIIGIGFFIGGLILLYLEFPISMSPFSRIPLGIILVILGIFLCVSVAPWVHEGAYSPNTTFNNFFERVDEGDAKGATDLTIFKFANSDGYNNSIENIQNNIDNNNYPDVLYPKIIRSSNISDEETFLTESDIEKIINKIEDDFNITVKDYCIIQYLYLPFDADDALGEDGEVLCIKVKRSFLLSSYYLVPKNYYLNQ